MPKPERGRIVLVDIADIHGRNWKDRPVVILTATEEIREDEQFWCAAITGTLEKPLPTDCVLLPWHRQRQPKTGLTKKCAVKCTWLVQITEREILRYVGVVPSKVLLEVLEKVDGIELG